jgi:ABC-type Fe3+/spermidine/putrescine transport system ATPase subunit
MSEIILHDVHKTYGDHVAVDGIDLKIGQGEFVTLLGPSGCGKTTCLRIVAGFVAPTSGRVSIAGRDVTSLPPHRRNTGMVFQSYALFPHRTVAGNVAFGLQVRRMARAERDRRTREALRLVQLEDLADRYPAQLSGGQRQRVALARAVVINPEILLLDEPLAALDLKLREELQVEIKRIQSSLNMTTLFVTHDQGEALSLSTRIAVMREGKIVQFGSPAEIYECPNSRYVANFVGRINLIPAIVRQKESESRYRVAPAAGGTRSSTFAVSGPQPAAFAIGDRCLLAVRPEHLHFGSDDSQNAISLAVNNTTYRGNVWHIDGHGPAGEALTVLAGPGEAIPAIGTTARVQWHPKNCFLLQPN